MGRLLGWQGRDSTRKKGMEAVTQRERGSPLPHMVGSKSLTLVKKSLWINCHGG